MDAIYLPSITGQFGHWRYYQIIMSVKNIAEIQGYDKNKAPIYRIKTVDEVEEIYSKNMNEMLQRVFSEDRLEPIKNYLIKQDDKYINNLTVAIFGGEPEWIPIGLKSTSADIIENEEAFEEVSKAFGVIRFIGEEILFVLDGQHRVKGLREALQHDPKIGNAEISITLISHTPTKIGKERTRRLFTTVNRYAKPVSAGESILLDEDDLSAIIARTTVEEYEKLKGKNLIALNKEANLVFPRDDDKFTTITTLWTINEKLIDTNVYPAYDGPKKNLVRVRPADEVIEKVKKEVFSYWDLFFKTFPKANAFVLDPLKNVRGKTEPFSLRPIGQTIFNKFYLKVQSSKSSDITDIRKIPDDLKNEFWHYVLWNPISDTLTGTESYARNYMYYHLGYSLTKAETSKLLEDYRKFRGDNDAKLPPRKYAK